MDAHYLIHYAAAFGVVLLAAGVVVWTGGFEANTGVTAFASVDVPQTQPLEVNSTNVPDSSEPEQRPGSW